MDIIKLYQTFNIPYRDRGHKHTRPGWVNVECPFCSGNPGFHLGYCIDPRSQFYKKFVCWRCGGKGALKTLITLLKVEEAEARIILTQYGGSSFIPKPEPKPIRVLRNIPLPPGTKALKNFPGALRYLEKRGFDPKELEEVWDIQATGPSSLVRSRDQIVDYRYRLIIPIYYHNKLVTYQARDWTGKNNRKYLACVPDLESVPIKEILYGLDKAEGIEDVALMEGVTDVWRYGPGGLACFGIKYREEQIRELRRRYKRIEVMFDPEPQAKIQAQKIVRKLEESGVYVKVRRLPKGMDPADMKKEDLC